MSYNASMRVWRGDQDGGALQDFTVEHHPAQGIATR